MQTRKAKQKTTDWATITCCQSVKRHRRQIDLYTSPSDSALCLRLDAAQGSSATGSLSSRCCSASGHGNKTGPQRAWRSEKKREVAMEDQIFLVSSSFHAHLRTTWVGNRELPIQTSANASCLKEEGGGGGLPLHSLEPLQLICHLQAGRLSLSLTLLHCAFH